jgi:hypothetical protein
MELAAQTEQKRLELEAEAQQTKAALTTKLEVQKIQIQKEADEEKFRIDSELRNKKAEKQLAVEQAQIDRLKAEGDATAKVATAKGEAGARMALAKAQAEETRATVANVTPMHVMMHAYDALGRIGGSGANVMLGDWSKVPNWLLPKTSAFQSMWGPWQSYPMPQMMMAPPMGQTKLSQGGHEDTN